MTAKTSITAAKVRKMIIKTQLDKQGLAAVYIEYLTYDANLNKSTKRIPTGVRVSPKCWSKSKQEVLKSDPDYQQKNASIEKAYLNSLVPPKPVVKKSKYIQDYIDEYITYRKARGDVQGTVKEFTTCKNRLKRYEAQIGKQLKFADINNSFSDAFGVWLYSENFKQGTIGKTFSILRTIMNHFYSRRTELGIEISDTFREKQWKKGSASVNDPHPMVGDNWHKFIFAQGLTPAQERIRDRFIWQCATGLRFGDAFTVTRDMIVNNCIRIYPQKTQHKKDNLTYINLNPLSTKILAKYQWDLTQLKITNQIYNKELKALCVKVKIEEFTSHDGRDTFITNCVNAGIDIPTILSWTNQNSYEIMRRYFKIDEQKKAVDMAKLTIYKDEVQETRDFLATDEEMLNS